MRDAQAKDCWAKKLESFLREALGVRDKRVDDDSAPVRAMQTDAVGERFARVVINMSGLGIV